MEKENVVVVLQNSLIFVLSVSKNNSEWFMKIEGYLSRHKNINLFDILQL